MRLLIKTRGSLEPPVEIFEDEVVANRSHGDFELCRMLTQLSDPESMKIDHWDADGSILRVWSDEVYMNFEYDVQDIKRAIAIAMRCEKELADRFLEEQDEYLPLRPGVIRD